MSEPDADSLSILFVCMGNICRSPTAQGVAEKVLGDAQLLHRVRVDSAGTHAYHVGEPPDPRTIAAAARRGYDVSRQRARRVVDEDFHRFDMILAMDRENLANLRAMAPTDGRAGVSLFLAYGDEADVEEVPDPYYGRRGGFRAGARLDRGGGKRSCRPAEVSRLTPGNAHSALPGRPPSHSSKVAQRCASRRCQSWLLWVAR